MRKRGEDIVYDNTVTHALYKAPLASFRASGESPILTGDVDGDWDVDAADLTLVARHVGGIELLSDEMLKNADVDGNGIVNARDLTIHARFTGGIILRWKDDADQTA